MSPTDFSTIDAVEAAWMAALAAPSSELMRALVHPEFIAVHGPTGQAQTAEDFLTDSETRPSAQHVQVLAATIRQIGDVVTVKGIEEYRIQFVRMQRRSSFKQQLHGCGSAAMKGGNSSTPDGAAIPAGLNHERTARQAFDPVGCAPTLVRQLTMLSGMQLRNH